MKRIVCNGLVDIVGGAASVVDLREVPSGQTSPRWATNDIVSRMLVSICCLLTSRNNSLKDGVDANSAVWVQRHAFAIGVDLGKILRINSSTEKKVQVDINRLIEDDYVRQLVTRYIGENLLSAPGASVQFDPGAYSERSQISSYQTP
jgi:hypothetical protein